MRRWLLVALTFPLIFAQYEQPTKTHDSYDKPLKVFGEANEHKAQEHLLEGPDGLPVVDPLAGYGREPPAPSIDLPGSEPLPPGPPTTAAPPAPESYNPVSSPGEAQRPGEETPSAASTAGPAKEKKEEAVATAEKATSTDDKYETAPAKTEEVATSPVPGSPSLPLDSSPPGGNENATAGAYQSPNGATVPAETADKAEISSSPASVENIVPETTAASVSEADTTAAFSQTESAKPESYEKPGGPAKEELKVPSPGSLETGSSPAAPIFQPASESSTPSAEAGYESAPGDQIVETQKTSLPTDTTQGQQESTAQTEGVVSSSAVYKTTPVEAAPTTTFKPEDTYVTSPDSPPEEKKPVVELLASGEKSSISSSGPQGETKPVENTISVPEQPAGNYEGSNEKAKTEAPVEAPSTVALSPSSEAPIESTAASSEPAYSTEASSISEVTTEQPKEEAKTGSPKSAEEMIPEHPPTLEEGYVPTGEKSVEVKADVTPAAAETIEGSGTTSAEKTNEYLKSGERSPKSGEIEGSGMIPVEEGSGLTSPAEQTPTTISVTVFAPSAPTSAEIQAATLPPYSAESPESVEGSGKSSETPEETTKSSASSESSTASSEQATPSSAEKAGYVEKVGGGEEKKSTEGSQEAPAEMKSPAETKKEPTAVGETKGAGGYEEKAKKVEGRSTDALLEESRDSEDEEEEVEIVTTRTTVTNKAPKIDGEVGISPENLPLPSELRESSPKLDKIILHEIDEMTLKRLQDEKEKEELDSRLAGEVRKKIKRIKDSSHEEDEEEEERVRSEKKGNISEEEHRAKLRKVVLDLVQAKLERANSSLKVNGQSASDQKPKTTRSKKVQEEPLLLVGPVIVDQTEEPPPSTTTSPPTTIEMLSREEKIVAGIDSELNKDILMTEDEKSTEIVDSQGSKLVKMSSGSLVEMVPKGVRVISKNPEPIVIIEARNETDDGDLPVKKRTKKVKKVHKLKRVKVIHRTRTPPARDLPTYSGEKDLSEEKVILPFDVKTTPWQYVTAPGERTAKPGVTLQPEASRNDGEDVKTSVELETSSAIPTAEEKKSEKDILTTVTSTKITDKPSIEFSTDTTNNNMELEPSGYEMGHESVIFTPDLPPIKPEEAVGYDGIAKDESKQHDLPQRQDFNVNSGETKVVQRKIDRSFFLEEQRPKWTPYRFDCNTEEDEKGALCKEWAVSGLCEQHRPTMFLFCRKTCLCTGPFARRKRFAYSLF